MCISLLAIKSTYDTYVFLTSIIKKSKYEWTVWGDPHFFSSPQIHWYFVAPFSSTFTMMRFCCFRSPYFSMVVCVSSIDCGSLSVQGPQPPEHMAFEIILIWLNVIVLVGSGGFGMPHFIQF